MQTLPQALVLSCAPTTESMRKGPVAAILDGRERNAQSDIMSAKFQIATTMAIVLMGNVNVPEATLANFVSRVS